MKKHGHVDNINKDNIRMNYEVNLTFILVISRGWTMI